MHLQPLVRRADKYRRLVEKLWLNWQSSGITGGHLWLHALYVPLSVSEVHANAKFKYLEADQAM